jgi:hypothetical protein
MMKEFGFEKSTADPALFYKKDCLICVYVDDLLIISRTEELGIEVKAQLMEKYEATDLGKLKHYLGMIWERDYGNKTSFLSQKRYIEDILRKYKMEDCKPNQIPIPPNTDLGCRDFEDLFIDVKKYQEAVGSLLYLALGTRPDIAFAVSVVSRYMTNPRVGHWGLVKGTLRYLRGTWDFGLKYSGKFCDLVGFVDADWGSDVMGRRSTSVYMFLIGGPISWSSKRQKTVALSTVEAEYMALSACLQKCIWLVSLCNEVGVSIKMPIKIFQDNEGSIRLAKNPGQHGRTKHIDIRHHFLRGNIERKLITLEFCPSMDMVADLLTKPLARPQYSKLRGMMNIMSFDHGEVLNLCIDDSGDSNDQR